MAVAAWAPGANAATVSVSGTNVVRYRAVSGEVNDVRVARPASDQVTLSDSRATIRAAAPCRSRNRHAVVCPAPVERIVADVAVGDGNDNVQAGGALITRIHGGPGRDRLNGGDDNDLLYGGSGNDVLSAGNGLNVLWGGPGNDSLLGGSGDDGLVGGRGGDLMAGGAGFDAIDARDPGPDDRADVVGCGVDGDYVEGRRPTNARVRDADLFTTDCEQLRLALPFTYVTVPAHPLAADSFSLSFSCPRRAFRLGCSSAILVKDGARLIAAGRQRLDNARDTLVRVPLSAAGRSLAGSGAAFPALVRVRYRVRHVQRTATFHLLIPPPA